MFLNLKDFDFNLEDCNLFSQDFSKSYLESKELFPHCAFYGWEINQSKEVVMHLVDKINAGLMLPRIPVVPIGRSEYCLIPDFYRNDTNRIDGGHHRIIAYRLARKNIPVDIYDTIVPGRVNQLITENNLISKKNELEFRIATDENYRK